MGVYVSITMSKDHKEKAIEAFGEDASDGRWDDEGEKETITYILENARHGGDEHTLALTEEKIPFLGWHGADDYPAMNFASHDGLKIEVQVDDAGFYVHVGEDGQVDQEEMQAIQTYLTMAEEVKKRIYKNS